MSITYGFYNSNDGDRVYDAEQVSSMFDGFVGDGVHQSIGGQLLVKSMSSMSVKVQTGRAWFNHTWTLNDSEITMTVPAAHSVLNRIDAVVLTVNASRNVRANSIDYITGTPASNPSRPALTKTGTIHQYALAYIYVGVGATSISQANITNMIGTSETPFVAGLAQIMSVDDIIAQWQAEWREWFEAQPAVFEEFVTEFEADMNAWKSLSETEFNAWKADSKADFDDWFANLHYILDGDVAGHLQNEIDQASGSIINIETDDTSLYGTTVQLEGSNTHMSTTFDSLGKASFKGVTEVGTLTVIADDGDTEMDIGIECFSNYTFSLRAFRAYVNVTLVDEILLGNDIHVVGPALNTTITPDQTGHASIVLKRPGSYTFSVDYNE